MKNIFKPHTRKILTTTLLSISSMFMLSQAFADEAPKWPDGKKAAISLTYDDALISHLESAIPTLDKYGLKGTFYLTVGVPVFTQRVDEWRKVAKTGHELGNHSLFHPCSGLKTHPERDWVVPSKDLNTYTVARAIQEISLANDLLKAVDGEETRSFAYPCGETKADGVSFVEGLKPLVVGARAVSGGVLQLSDTRNKAFTIPTYNGAEKTGKELIAIADEIIATGGYGTIMFHGVGADHIVVSTKAHKELAAYLNTRKKDVWIDTVREINTYYNATQGK